MSGNQIVRVGVVGARFLAETRARCYAALPGRSAVITAVAARTEASARAFASRHGVPHAFSEARALFESSDVDVVDLCVPNHLHRPLTEAAALAGKHVICTKPLTAYVGQDLPESAQDADVAGRGRRTMWRVAVEDAAAMVTACNNAGVQLMYGENWIYAPSIVRARRLLETSGGAILEMRGGECHSGSHSPYSKVWRSTGGGSLLRMGSHPVGAMLHLKREEGRARNGQPTHVVAVTAEAADVSTLAPVIAGKSTFVATGWQDVENWGVAILMFSDGSRGVVYASDIVLGGMESRLEIFATNTHLKCQMSPHDLLRAFAPDGSVFGDAYLMEKVESRAGWSTPHPNEDWSSGHVAMCADFIGAVAENRPAASSGDLGLAVVDVLYAAYVSAAEGRRVRLDELEVKDPPAR